MERKRFIHQNGLTHPESDGWGELADLWAIEETAREIHQPDCGVDDCPLCAQLRAYEKGNSIFGQWLTVSRFITRIFGRVNPAVACLMKDETPPCVADIPETIGKLFALPLEQQAELYGCPLSELEAIKEKRSIKDDGFWINVAVKLSSYVMERFGIGVG